MMVSINLTDKTISLRFGGGRKVSLVFEGDDPYFYLLFATLVAREMKKIASRGSDRPFVPFCRILHETRLLAKAVKRRPFETDKSMAESIYGNWPRRFTPPGSCFFVARPELIEEEELRVTELFGREKGKAGLKARYRINRPVSEITIKDPEVLEDIICKLPAGDKSAKLRHLPSYIPYKPYYEGLKKHEELIRSSVEILEQGSVGQSLLLWGMGGIGKSTIAAELARRYTQRKTSRGVLWIQLAASPSKTSSQAESLHAQIADTMIAQLGLFDMLNEPLSTKVTRLANEEVLSQFMLVVDNMDPVDHKVDDLAAVLEEVQPRCTIVTCRPNLYLRQACPVKLTSLDPEDGVHFLQTDAKRRNIGSVLPKKRAILAKMCEVTGGVPFAMQLALGQTMRLPWEKVLEHCAAGQPQLYYYLFRDLWKMLGEAAKKTLVYMRTSPEGIDIDELLAAVRIGSADEILTAVDELVRLALLDVRHLSETSATYSIHPLTYNFITTELHQVWSEEDEARK